MAVPAEPNAEALANLIQVQGQAQPLVQDQQVQAQEQQPQAQAQQPEAPPGAAAIFPFVNNRCHFRETWKIISSFYGVQA